jgi:hypothetical protein
MKTRKPISPVSKKREKINAIYGPKAASFRYDNPKCVILSPVCTGATQGVHHVKGKATEELLLDENFWLPACNACNDYIEEKPLWAIANGFKKPHNHDGRRKI